jgi:hypothetical protein
MIGAIDFDRQLHGVTVEVQDIGPMGCCRRNFRRSIAPRLIAFQSSTSGRLIARRSVLGDAW